ncbi:hypothetical protein B0T24DRAFT_666312 [Lasiosphaeria ovina]|uniref:Uncharacterized protein n=1 Tax=Lasiosphaeria ovina TaxID=92902 RepID=A0AAE0KB32_9PEZI|nr:hypothetical protein B0T24DRAFT_666312 [Lasiosphaeria ovina]
MLGRACKFFDSTSQLISRVSFGDAFLGEAKRLLASEHTHVNLPSIQALGVLALTEMSHGNDNDACDLAEESQDNQLDDDFKAVRALSYCGGFSLIRHGSNEVQPAPPPLDASSEAIIFLIITYQTRHSLAYLPPLLPHMVLAAVLYQLTLVVDPHHSTQQQQHHQQQPQQQRVFSGSPVPVFPQTAYGSPHYLKPNPGAAEASRMLRDLGPVKDLVGSGLNVTLLTEVLSFPMHAFPLASNLRVAASLAFQQKTTPTPDQVVISRPLDSAEAAASH